jgi:hypothetical protein
MAKYVFSLVAALVIFTGIIITVCKARPSGDNSLENLSIKDRFNNLNNLSRTADISKDDASIKAFTDSVVDMIVPSAAASIVLKDRLFALEKQHRTTHDVGITEESLARGINSFVTRIGAPEFAQTSALQLRVFRAQLHFMGLSEVVAPGLSSTQARQTNPQPGDPVASISDSVGPAEASVVIATLTRSKLTREDLQTAPDEWSKSFFLKHSQARANQLAADASQHRSPMQSVPVHSLQALSLTPAASALQSNLQTFSQSLTSSDALNRELDTFVKESRNE